jgi:aryl-alcohol dehydrogenase-like predicted oxidoreductase
MMLDSSTSAFELLIDIAGATMADDFRFSVLGGTGIKVCRLGLSATYRPGKKTIHRALDFGLNFFFCYGFDTHMIHVLRDMPRSSREKVVIATGAYNLILGHPDLRRTLEKRLRQLKTDYIDAFLFLGVMKPKQFSEEVVEQLRRFREEGKVRAIGLSCHDRGFVGRLASEGAVDVIMMRYNAAHRGAEDEIFPHLTAHDPGVISYTATRWSFLLRRPHDWPREKSIPTAAQCYRFVLSRPEVDVCLTAPSNIGQLEENLSALDQGPLPADEISFMREFGDVVHKAHKRFM